MLYPTTSYSCFMFPLKFNYNVCIKFQFDYLYYNLCLRDEFTKYFAFIPFRYSLF